MRVRGFTQDDAHIFCLPEQLSDEILGVLDLTEKILSRFGFDKYVVNLSTRPEKSVGERARRARGRALGDRPSCGEVGMAPRRRAPDARSRHPPFRWSPLSVPASAQARTISGTRRRPRW